MLIVSHDIFTALSVVFGEQRVDFRIPAHDCRYKKTTSKAHCDFSDFVVRNSAVE